METIRWGNDGTEYYIILAQQVLQLQHQGVHRPVRAVQDGDLQGIVVIRIAGGDEPRPHPQILSQRSKTAPARISGVRLVRELQCMETIRWGNDGTEYYIIYEKEGEK